MSTHNIQFHDKIKKKIPIGITSYGLIKEFELAMVNESSVFELLRFDCIFSQVVEWTCSAFRGIR